MQQAHGLVLDLTTQEIADLLDWAQEHHEDLATLAKRVLLDEVAR